MGVVCISTEEGKDLDLEARRDELTDSTLSAQKNRFEASVQWCDDTDIDNLNELTGRDLFTYQVWPKGERGPSRLRHTGQSVRSNETCFTPKEPRPPLPRTVEGTDAVTELPEPIGALTYNEWHALAMGAVTAILPALAHVAAFALYEDHPIPAGGFAAGALAYAGGFTALATIARFLDRVPVLREAWYFLSTYTAVLLCSVTVAVLFVR